MALIIIKVLYFFGFVLQMIGGYLLYKNSFPPNINPYGITYLFNGISPEQQEKHDKYLKRSRLGFLLLLIGFVFQIFLNFRGCFLVDE